MLKLVLKHSHSYTLLFSAWGSARGSALDDSVTVLVLEQPKSILGTTRGKVGQHHRTPLPGSDQNALSRIFLESLVLYAPMQQIKGKFPVSGRKIHG